MTPAARIARGRLAVALERRQLRHGLQLAVAVLVAYGVSAALALPESFWAVMSALLVARPQTGAALGAGWDRVRGAVVGTLFGLAGVWLRHRGLGSDGATLGIVAALAFGSAFVAPLRSAPLTALILLTSSGVAGHPALQVAGLRVAEISIGVCAGMGVSLIGTASRAGRQFDRDCAALLRDVASRLSLPPASTTDPPGAEAAAEAWRQRLRDLAVLGVAADREHRWRLHRHPAGSTGRDAHRRIARLVARTAQDADLVTRLFEALPRLQAAPAWRDVAGAMRAALIATADRIEGRATADLAPLRRFARPLEGAFSEAGAAMAGPVNLLLRDLIALDRLYGSPEGGQPSRG